MKHIKDFKTYEALIQKSSLDQLKRVMSVSKNTDIDNKVRKSIKEGPKRHRNPITNGVETYQQYMSEPFKTNQNVQKWNESLKDIYDNVLNEYGESCNIEMLDNCIQVQSTMKHILDDLSYEYGGDIDKVDDYYNLKIKG